MHRYWTNTALCVALLTSAASVAGSGETEEPHDRYRVLEWNELVPEGWRLAGIFCDNGQTVTGSDSVTVNLQQGVDVTCTFVNRREQEIVEVMPVPSLSQWGLAGLSLLLALSAVFAMMRRKRINP